MPDVHEGAGGVRRAAVRLALVLSAVLTVSVSLTPVTGSAMLWVGQRR